MRAGGLLTWDNQRKKHRLTQVRRFTRMVKYNSTQPMELKTDGKGAAGHAGLWQLGQFMDQLGIPKVWSTAFEPPGRGGRRHDPGKTLAHAVLMFAGGGEACTDIEYLRAQPELFGDVGSDSTLSRLLLNLSEATSRRLTEGLARVRARLWKQLTSHTNTEGVVLDIDSSVHEIHSENKENTAPAYTGGYGFHPIYAFWDATGECLAALLRPGNAGANKVDDHLTVLEQAMSVLPDYAVSSGVRIRVDSAGGPSLAWESRRRQVGYSIVARYRRDIEAAVYLLDRDGLAWEDALPAEAGGEVTAQVTEATHLVDTSGWPPGTRLIIRRERKHPGARRTLFRSDNYRYQGHWTDQAFTPPEADLDIRRHARCENHIARIKDSGAQRFPFQPFGANQAWLLAVVLADTLVLWFQTICLGGTSLRRARPKTMRWGYWHTPARITRHARRLLLRIPRCWPAAPFIAQAHRLILQL